MNNSIPSRVLMLEQLEARCLLTGGMLSHSITNRFLDDQANHSQEVQTNHSRDVQSRSNRSVIGPRFHDAQRGAKFNRPNDGHDKQTTNSEQTPSVNSVQFSFIYVAPTDRNANTVPSERPTSNNTSPAVNASPTLNETSINLISNVSTETGATDPISKDELNPKEPTANVTTTSTNDSTSRPERPPTSLKDFQSIGIQAIEYAEIEAVDTGVPDTDASDPTVSTDNLSTSDTNATIARSAGVIDSLPLLRRELNHEAEQYQSQDPQSPESDEVWEIDLNTIRRLKDTGAEPAKPSNFDLRVDTAKHTDQVIAGWFGATTGLIDLTSNQELVQHTDQFASFVDVVLDATVGMHRRVELIAASDVSNVPSDIRSKILAAIADEQPKLWDPLHEEPPLRVSAVAYPGAVIVASTLALTAHRRKQALLQSTS
ncbi:hypothetical protein CA13_07610 [Planctomycetes bacterium CA13]|uniref:Uncharacterized protein n=1 Tax=Novipirellula herctigrandis TaxID=2527986 RepID=A0A5C5YXD1_9BACT|nr:hypothetical protein CA13_07610 [Planctomycetes bacterium CA13]